MHRWSLFLRVIFYYLFSHLHYNSSLQYLKEFMCVRDHGMAVCHSMGQRLSHSLKKPIYQQVLKPAGANETSAQQPQNTI